MRAASADDSDDLELQRLRRAAQSAALSQGLNWVDAEDVASLALVDFLEAPVEIEHPFAWIVLVAKRRAWDLSRRESMRVQREGMKAACSDSAHRHFDNVEALLDLRAALDALDEVERRALVSKYLEEEQLDWIAAVTGFSLTTLQRRLVRGRNSLLRALTGQTVRRYRSLLPRRELTSPS